MQGAQGGHAPEQRLELLLDGVHLLAGELLQRRRLVEQICIGFDLGKRQPQVLQGQNAIQVFHVVVGVQALVLRTLRRRREQALLVVVLDRAHRHPDAPGQLSHGQVSLIGHAAAPHEAPHPLDAAASSSSVERPRPTETEHMR